MQFTLGMPFLGWNQESKKLIFIKFFKSFGVLLYSIDKNIFFSVPTNILHTTIFNKILFLSYLNYKDSSYLIKNHI